MRWPWRKREKRDSGGDFSDAVVRLIEAQAAGKAADASSTAAVEAASGALSRAFASARVEGPPHVLEAVTGRSRNCSRSPRMGETVERKTRSPCSRPILRGARGKALLLETVAAGWGDGRSAAPQRDWQASRLGPTPPESMVRVRSDAFEAVLAATGTPPSLFVDSDGTSQREAVRRWHMGTVEPLAKLLEEELSEKL